MSGHLYIVATPIGNLQDVSQRALETLKNVDLILAEDTRVTKKLLSKYDISTKLISYHHHSSENRKLEILQKLQIGESLALVTDAGTPGISDPGNELLDFIYKSQPAAALPLAGVPKSRKYQHVERLAAPKGPTKEREPDIKVVPGPSSLTAALSLCGFNTSKFIFAGFFPKKKANRWLNTYFTLDITTIYFDSPHRLIKNLQKLQPFVSENRRIFIARELTKLHEETFRGTISEVLRLLSTANPKGEVVVVVEKPSP